MTWPLKPKLWLERPPLCKSSKSSKPNFYFPSGWNSLRREGMIGSTSTTAFFQPRDHPAGTVRNDFFLKTFQDQLGLSDAMQVLDGAGLVRQIRQPKKKIRGASKNRWKIAKVKSSCFVKFIFPNGRNPNSAYVSLAATKESHNLNPNWLKIIKLTCYDTHTSTSTQ